MLALVREVSPQLAQCELSHIARAPIDAERAVRQHRAYTETLAGLGCRLEWLPALAQHPDGVFVEDTAVVLPELAVLTHPGIASRRGETPSVAEALARRLPVVRITAPASLDGGDVLSIGRRLFVGASARSNGAGVSQLADAVRRFGYSVAAVPLSGCLHLKSACTFIPPDLLLVNSAWVDPAEFGTGRVVEVAEPYGGNTLTVAGVTLVSTLYPRTQERLEQAGVRTRALDVSELHKAEAALTCMSLILG
jgi:dimethylargininase